MSEVTIVCCYNNDEQYNNFVDSLKAQNYPFEIIGLDNRGNKNFTSCSSAYNSVKDKIKTKYVIYSHQDILMTEPGNLEKFVSYLDKIDPDDILGVAGRRDDIMLYSSIKHILKESGKIADAGRYPVKDGMIECDTLDECFFGGYTKHFRQYPFDEVICNNWHLYAVEACLRTRSKILGGGGA